jgi:FkbM family methyltransferase
MLVKISYSQTGLLKPIERLIRSHPLIYLIVRNLIRYTNIFEDDAKAVKYIQFNKEKINLIDIGASDGVSINYFKKILNINKCFCFEPNKHFIKILKKRRFSNTKIYSYGLGEKRKAHIYIPYYIFFGKIFYLNTYAFYNKNELLHQIKLDFFLKKNIPVEKFIITINKMPEINNNIDLIKIDVNGNEHEVILNIKKIINKNKPALIIEASKDIYKIIKILKKINYNVYHFRSDKNLFVKGKNTESLNYYFLQDKHLK